MILGMRFAFNNDEKILIVPFRDYEFRLSRPISRFTRVFKQFRDEWIFAFLFLH